MEMDDSSGYLKLTLEEKSTIKVVGWVYYCLWKCDRTYLSHAKGFACCFRVVAFCAFLLPCSSPLILKFCSNFKRNVWTLFWLFLIGSTEISQFSQDLFHHHGECSMTQIKELLILMLIEMCSCVCHGMIEIMLKIMLIMSTQLNFGSIKELGKSFRLLFLLHLPVCVCHCCSLE